MRGQARGFRVDQQIAPRRRFDPCRFPADDPATPCARSAKTPASAANICRAGPAPVCRVRPNRRRAWPCRPSGAPDRRRAQASMPDRRPPAVPDTGLFAHAATSRASVNRRSSSPSRGGISSGVDTANCSEPSGNANSSSSMSPRATMRGRIAASVLNSSRKISRASRRRAGSADRVWLARGAGILARLESIDQPAIDQCGDDGAQERHGYWYAENTHGLPDSRIRRQYRELFRWSWCTRVPLLPSCEKCVGWAKRSVPTTSDEFRCEMGRGAAPCHRRTQTTPRFPETPLPLPGPHRGFRHASRRRRAAGRTGAPAHWRDRTSSSAKTRPRAHRQTATAT